MSTQLPHRNALISVAVFLVLLVLVFVTREDRVAVGIRTLALAEVQQDAVSKIELAGKHTALLEKGEGGWTVAAPDKPDARFAAEQSAVTEALDALGELEAGTFVTGRAEKHAELGVDDEKGLQVTVHQPGKEPLALVFGRSAQGGGHYLRLQGSDEVFVGKGSLAAKLQKDVSDWRKKKLLDEELAAVQSVLVEPAAEASYTLEAREESSGEGESAITKTTWAFASDVALPEGFRSDGDLLRRVASTAANLRASAFVDEAKSADETGLSDKPALGRVVVKRKDGKSVAVRFGKEDDQKRIYAQIEGEPQIYLLQSYQTKNLLKTIEELRDLTLVRFEPSAVERFTLTSPGGTVELSKQDGAWTMTQPSAPPEGYEFDPGRVDAALSVLARLKAQQRYADAPAGHGTGSPTTKLTLQLAGGTSKSIAFGAAVPGDEGGKRVYVLGAEDGNIHAVAEHQKVRFDKPLALFKKLPPPPPPPQGMGGGIPGMENLPPDVRKKLEESLRQQGLAGR